MISRLYAHFMEPLGVIGACDQDEERYTLYADAQYLDWARNALANRRSQIPGNKIRIISGDVGGRFGTKEWQYP